MQNYEQWLEQLIRRVCVCVCFSVYEGNSEMKYAMVSNNFLMFLFM